jgi:cytochrome b6-f complex iron-sulfur subunit
MDAATVPNRRKFINWFLGTSFGALTVSIVYPVLRYISPPRIAEATTQEVEAGETNDPAYLEKGFKIIRFGAEPVIVVKIGETEYRAWAATCTHLDCIVGYQKDKSRLFCNCHGGAYDLTGRNTAGPPPRPLLAYKVNLAPKPSGTSVIVVSKA